MQKPKQKRFRNPNAKKGELKVGFGRESVHDNPELLFCHHPEERTAKGDAITLMDFFHHAKLDGSQLSLVQELEARGYDIRTLKLTIQKKV